MEILTTATVQDKVLNLEQTINFPNDRFVTIKELFSINGEIFVSLINHSIPYTINANGTNVITNRFIMPAEQFLVYYGGHL